MTDQTNLEVCPFTILVDCREKHPYTFDRLLLGTYGNLLLTKTEIEYLPTGDYAISGMADECVVERKTILDLYGSLGKNRPRLEREFERMECMSYAAIVVEGDWKEICNPGRYHANWISKMNPKAVYSTILSWQQRFPGVHWLTAGTRRMGEMLTFSALEWYWRNSHV
jgi:ERCC4-type nuclease